MVRWLLGLVSVAIISGLAMPAAAEGMAPGGLIYGNKNAFIGADVVFMRRANKGADRVLVVDENTDGNAADDVPILRTRDLKAFDSFEPGFEIKGGVRILERLWLTAQFMWINDYKASAGGLGDAGQVGFPGGESNALSNFGDSDQFQAKLRSSLATLTLRGQYAVTPDIFFIGGFRYLRLAETLEVELIEFSGSDDHSHYLRVRNNLFGAEAGLMWHREVLPNVFIKLIGTGGAFANNTDFERRLITGDSAGVAAGSQINERTRRTAFSFVGDLQARISYQPWSNVQIFVGYRALFVTGVGLATNQVVYDFNQATGFPAQNVGISRSTAIYHGGFVGAKLVF